MSANPKKLPRAPKPNAEPVKALTVIERAAQALAITQTEDDLRALAQASTSLTVITNQAGLDQVHGARMVLKNTRIEIEKKGIAAREDANAFSKAVIAKQKELVGIISPEELRLQGLQDAYEAEQKRIKDEAIAREQKRVADLQARVEAIKTMPSQYAQSTAAEIEQAYDALSAQDISGFEEFLDIAVDAKLNALGRLRSMHEAATQREAQLAREKAEREAEAKRLADERAELERRKAEQDRKDREAQAQRDADAAAIRKQREDLERQQREAEAARQAEADRVAAERKKLEEEQAAFRKEQEEAAERARVAALPPVEVVGAGDPAPVIVGGDERPLTSATAAHFDAIDPVAVSVTVSVPAPKNDIMDRPLASAIINQVAREWDITPERAADWILLVAQDIKESRAALMVGATVLS